MIRILNAKLSVLTDEYSGIGRNAFHAPGKSQSFGGGGFDADGIDIDVHEGSKNALHGGNVGIDLRSLGTNGAVDVADVVALSGNEVGGAAKKNLAVDALKFSASVGEVVAYVTHIGGTEYSVANGMDKYISIAVAEESVGVRYLDAAKPEVAVFYEFMDVIAHSNADCHNGEV